MTVDGDGDGLRVRFNTSNGTLTSLTYRDREVIAAGPRFNVWRAPTDNDGIKLRGNQWKPLGRWQAVGLDGVKIKTHKTSVKTQKNGSVVFDVHQTALPSKVKYGFDIRHTYTVLSSGDVHVANTIVADRRLPDLPRIGVNMTLRPGLERFAWFGRGPYENYWDRKRGAALGYYESTVTDQYVPYVMPQEHGNHTDVRWLSLATEDHGLLIVPDDLMECTVSHFAIEDLVGAHHTSDLEMREAVYLNLDVHQRGLGGASCGPDTLPEYCIQPGTFAFGYRLRPYLIGEENLQGLALQKLGI